eukprot:jgi/Botrbrau1/11279/Bobra.0038s0045.1
MCPLGLWVSPCVRTLWVYTDMNWHYTLFFRLLHICMTSARLRTTKVDVCKILEMDFFNGQWC